MESNHAMAIHFIRVLQRRLRWLHDEQFEAGNMPDGERAAADYNPLTARHGASAE
jgi:hypothetical protein